MTIYILGTGFSYFCSDWDDAYINAQNEAEANMCEYNQEVIEWLEENVQNKYTISDEYIIIDSFDVSCNMQLVFSDLESEIAFKLAWSDRIPYLLEP